MFVRSFAFGGTVCVVMYKRKNFKKSTVRDFEELFLKTKQGYSSSHHCYAVSLELLPHGFQKFYTYIQRLLYIQYYFYNACTYLLVNQWLFMIDVGGDGKQFNILTMA